MFWLFVGMTLVLGIWIISLRSKLNNVTKSDEDYWKKKYEQAADSIKLIRTERDKLRTERDYLDSTRVYWYSQYKSADSLLNRSKSQYNEELDRIRNAGATELNGLLSDRLREINSRR